MLSSHSPHQPNMQHTRNPSKAGADVAVQWRGTSRVRDRSSCHSRQQAAALLMERVTCTETTLGCQREREQVSGFELLSVQFCRLTGWPAWFLGWWLSPHVLAVMVAVTHMLQGFAQCSTQLLLFSVQTCRQQRAHNTVDPAILYTVNRTVLQCYMLWRSTEIAQGVQQRIFWSQG
jgi:hypothetical protein